MRTLLLFALTLCLALPSWAQPARLELPDAATQVLAADPSSDAAAFITDDGLAFYRGQTMHIVQLPDQLVQTDANVDARYVAVVTLDDTATPAQLRLSVYDHDGRARYAHAMPHRYDDPFPTVAVNGATGAAAYGQSATNEVVFLDAVGDVVNRVRLFNNTGHELERVLHLAYAPDGQHIFVAAMRAPAGASAQTEANVALFAFTSDGTVWWNRPLDGPALQSLTVAEDGRHLAVSTYDAFDSDGATYQTRVFETNGTLVQSTPHGFERAAFTDDALLLVSRRRAVFLHLNEGHPRFTFEPAEHGVLIIDGTIRPDDRGAALLTATSRLGDGGYIYDHLQLLTVSPSGSLLDVATPAPDAAHSPRLHSTADGLHLILDRSVLAFPWTP